VLYLTSAADTFSQFAWPCRREYSARNHQIEVSKLARRYPKIPQNIKGGSRGPTKGTPYRKITPALKAAFLKAYRESGGSFSAACAATASPHHKPDQINPAGASTWRRLVKTDPEFGADFEEAKAAIIDDLEALAHKLAHGVKRRVYQKATLVFEPVLDDDGKPVLDDDGQPKMKPAEQTFHDSRVVLARLKALAPDKYGDRKEVNINHHSGAAVLTSADLMALSESERDQLQNILLKVQAHRKGEQLALADQREDAIEADFEEVRDDEEDYAEFDLGEEG